MRRFPNFYKCDNVVKKMAAGEIIGVAAGSIADELGITAGDKILSVNGETVRDVIDFSFALADEEIELLVEHADGEREIIAFDKDADEDFGAEFSSAVFDGIRRCANNCRFCFVNMTAPGMRESLSVKDDDYRLSFLYGNFITMTNMGDRDFERIKKFHLSPLYVSVHTTNGPLRAELLRSKKGADILAQLDKLAAAGAEYHTQIVLCRNLNDGAELSRTIADIAARRPFALSVAIVPAGITKHRRDPYPLLPFERDDAKKVIDDVRKWQQKFRRETGKSFVYLSDEFYLLTGEELPAEEYYDGFPQLDNGIGLARNFIADWEAADEAPDEHAAPTDIIAVCGTAIAPILQRLANEAAARRKNINARILPVANDYFGGSVNVSGLLTGRDIAAALHREGASRHGILIPESALRTGENIFLDDMTLDELRQMFPQSRIETVGDGREFKEALFAWGDYRKNYDKKEYMWQSNAAYTR